MAPAVNEDIAKHAEAIYAASLNGNPTVPLGSQGDQAKVLRGMMEKRQPGIIEQAGTQIDKTTGCRTIALCSGKG